MARVRPAAYAALLLIVLVTATASAAIPPGLDDPLAVVGWPPSTSLVVAEVVTGGASASDEYVEVANAGSAPADLAGLEVVYATSSGATVTKKAAWTDSLILLPGQHLLLANSAGTYASIADGVYTTGLAATGGAIVLRQTGGAVVDAVGWGDATNAFVEGSAAVAPAAGQSIERLPGAGDNTVDTNSNGADLGVSAAPVPQNLAALPVPPASPTPSPSSSASAEPSPTIAPSDSPAPTATASPVESPTATPDPTATASPGPSATESPAPTPSATAVPTPSESPEPTATASPVESPTATPEPTATVSPAPSATESPAPTPTESPAPSAMPSGTPEPTPEPTAAPLAIADVRALSDGSSATIEGVLTTALGALESGRTGFVQDPSGGIVLYLDAAYATPIPAGTWVRAAGVVGSRYGQRTLRVSGADVAIVAVTGLPAPLDVTTGAAGEALEGLRLRVSGVLTETPTSLADGLGLSIDDGSGPLRLVVAPAALGGATAVTGMVATAIGPLGQRDSSGTDTSGYRLFATLPGELVVAPAPTPNPTAAVTASPAPAVTPSETVAPSPSPTAALTASPSQPAASPTPVVTSSASPSLVPSATPAPLPEPLTVGEARHVPAGATALVRGVVTAEAGRLGTPSLFAIGDDFGGLPVRLADGMAAPPRGTLVEATGIMAEPYGQTELRLVAGGLTSLGTGPLPPPQRIVAGMLGEAVEGRLVTVSGVISTGAAKSTSGDIVFVLTGTDGTALRAYADASARLTTSAPTKGLAVTLTGVAGQHASRKGAFDGYRIWLRDVGDVVRDAGASASPGASPTPSVSPTPGVATVQSIATARARDGATVTVQGVVTADRTLLDGTGRLTVVQDATAAIELYLAAPDASVRLGVRVRVTGVVGRAWGAPRLRAAKVTLLGRESPAVLDLRLAPGPATEWRLVEVSGTVTSVHRTGERWVAELDAGTGGTIPIIALAGAGIPADAIAAGHRASVVGIVKRPYPSASDRRYAVLPRRTSDVSLGAIVQASARPSGSPAESAPVSAAPGQAAWSGGPGGDAPATDLRDLAARLGQRIRVGGIVTKATPDGFYLDDGTATARIILEGGAMSLAAVLAPGDGLDATGSVEDREGLVVVVRDPADIMLVGDLGGEAAPSGSPPAAGALVIGSTTPALAVRSGPASAPGAGGLAAILAVLAVIAAAAALSARRFRDRRRFRARLQHRLAALATAAASPWSPRSAPAEAGPAGPSGVADG